MDATMRCRIDLFLFPTFPPLVSVSDKLSRCLTLSSCGEERRHTGLYLLSRYYLPY